MIKKQEEICKELMEYTQILWEYVPHKKRFVSDNGSYIYRDYYSKEIVFGRTVNAKLTEMIGNFFKEENND